MTLSDDVDLLHTLADAADAQTTPGFSVGIAIDHERKGDGSAVSKFDRASETAILEILRRERPEDSVLGEEVGPHGPASAPRRWILDGIDGTREYVAGDPLWQTLIGLEVDGVPVAGMATSPALGMRWWAATGLGAWGQKTGTDTPERLSVATVETDGTITATLDYGYARDDQRSYLDAVADGCTLHDESAHIAIMVATGVSALGIQMGGSIWDFAALMPIVWEAGGTCRTINGAATTVAEAPMVWAGNLDAERLTDRLGAAPAPA